MGRANPATSSETVLLLGGGGSLGLEASIAREGYRLERVAELESAPVALAQEGVRALLIAARPLGVNDLLILRRCREVSPRTAIVVVTETPSQPDLKRAFESGATAFLSWPASPDTLRRALESGQERPERAHETGTEP